jgi:hypothetical protein
MEKTAVLAVLLVAGIACAQGKEFTKNCMACICKVEGCERQLDKCRQDVGSLSCGPYQIKDPYYKDCGTPGKDWQSCTKKMECSETCMKKYMDKYVKGCGPDPTCEDYARLHNGGPTGCKSDGTKGYWDKVKKCCDKKGGC